MRGAFFRRVERKGQPVPQPSSEVVEDLCALIRRCPSKSSVEQGYLMRAGAPPLKSGWPRRRQRTGLLGDRTGVTLVPLGKRGACGAYRTARGKSQSALLPAAVLELLAAPARAWLIAADPVSHIQLLGFLYEIDASD